MCMLKHNATFNLKNVKVYFTSLFFLLKLKSEKKNINIKNNRGHHFKKIYKYYYCCIYNFCRSSLFSY